jgi:hypothetical protein
VEVPVPPFATDKGVIKLAPTELQVLAEVQEERLFPGVAALLKNNCPTTHVVGRDVPTVTGLVTGIAEKSGFRAWVPRFTLVLVCPETTGTIQTRQGSRKRHVDFRFIKMSNG